MAAPNVVNVTTISGQTAVLAANTTAANVVTNGSGSNQLWKINSLVISNANTNASANASISLYRSATDYYIAKNVSIPYGASLVAIAKDTMIYLQEGDAIRVASSDNVSLTAICAYEIIS